MRDVFIDIQTTLPLDDEVNLFVTKGYINLSVTIVTAYSWNIFPFRASDAMQSDIRLLSKLSVSAMQVLPSKWCALTHFRVRQWVTSPTRCNIRCKLSTLNILFTLCCVLLWLGTPFTIHRLTLIPESCLMPSKMWGGMTYPSKHQRLREWISNLISRLTIAIISYPCWDYSQFMLVKVDPMRQHKITSISLVLVDGKQDNYRDLVQ